MLGVHWSVQNRFVHIGNGSLYSLGFDQRLFESKDSLFEFSDFDKEEISNELLSELPRQLPDLMTERRLGVGRLLATIGNRTAATNDKIGKAQCRERVGKN